MRRGAAGRLARAASAVVALTVLPPYRPTVWPSFAQAPAISVSANPVRGGSVTLRWPARGGTADVRVFSQTGTEVAREELANDPGRWVWNLRTSDGESVANGPYYIVVTLGDGTRLRRRLLVAR